MDFLVRGLQPAARFHGVNNAFLPFALPKINGFPVTTPGEH
jgi:hypothetical protein